MMKYPDLWTRREFSAVFASILGMSCFSAGAPSLNRPTNASRNFAYIGSRVDGDVGSVHVFAAEEDNWRHLQTISAVAPIHIERHPSLSVIYVVHAVNVWGHLPRGAVSAYSVEPETGSLKLLNTQPLSLSATSPRHATVSHNGEYLIVAAERGGAYNLLPIAGDGSLMATASVRKGLGLIEGRISKTARPQQILRHLDGRTILTADVGSEEIQSFCIEDSLLRLRHRLRVHPGSGARQIVLSKDGLWLYALNAANGSLSVHTFESSTGQVAAGKQLVTVTSPGARVMAIHPSGSILVTAGVDEPNEMLTYDIDRRCGYLTMIQRAPQHEAFRDFAFSADGRRLVSVGSDSGQVFQSDFHIAGGTIGKKRPLFQADGFSCLSLRPA